MALLASSIALIGGCADDVGSDDDTPIPLPRRDGSAPPDVGAPEADASTAPVLPPGPTGWVHRRPLTVTSDASSTLTSHAVLVVLPPTFAYDSTKADGADLRFSRAENHGDDLPYFIESWQPGGSSFVWVLPPNVPQGSSSLQLFYGNKDAPAASSFEAVFPKARRTAGGGAGSFTATGDIDVDWFELKAGDVLTLAAGAPLEITARRIILAGSVQGDGRGHAGGVDAANLTGKGPGGGSAVGGSGSGGGAYGGAGGRGGSDTAGGGGAGGAANGSDSNATIDMGSGGGSANPISGFKRGGAGGGAIALFGWRTSVSGPISVNGIDGLGGGGQNGGGGAGGGIVMAASLLELGGANLSAKGGAGGPCANSGNDGGGGGGGGRIKLLSRGTGVFVAPASMLVAAGAGGAGNATTAPGAAGLVGTATTNNAVNALTGVETSLGPELPGR